MNGKVRNALLVLLSVLLVFGLTFASPSQGFAGKKDTKAQSSTLTAISKQKATLENAANQLKNKFDSGKASKADYRNYGNPFTNGDLVTTHAIKDKGTKKEKKVYGYMLRGSHKATFIDRLAYMHEGESIKGVTEKHFWITRSYFYPFNRNENWGASEFYFKTKIDNAMTNSKAKGYKPIFLNNGLKLDDRIVHGRCSKSHTPGGAPFVDKTDRDYNQYSSDARNVTVDMKIALVAPETKAGQEVKTYTQLREFYEADAKKNDGVYTLHFVYYLVRTEEMNKNYGGQQKTQSVTQLVPFSIKWYPYGSVQLTKGVAGSNAKQVVKDGKITVAGAQYQLYDSNKKMLTNVGSKGLLTVGKADKNGNATSNTITGLKPGTYFVKESKAPTGFAADTSWHKVSVAGNKTATVQVSDEAIPDLTINKVSSAQVDVVARSDLYSLNGAVYQLYDKDKKVLKGKTFTIKAGDHDKVGTAKETYALAAGTYYLKETKAPKGFVLDTAYHKVTLTNGTSTVETLKDEPTTTVKLVKGIKGASNLTAVTKSSDFNLNGAQYQLYDKDKKVIKGKVFTIQAKATDKTGTAKETYMLEPGTYYVKETKAPEKGFSISPDYTKVVVKAAEDQTINVYDEPEATLTLQKGIKAANIEAIAKNPDFNLNGAQYQLYDSAKKAISGKVFTIQAKATDKVGVSKEKYTLAPGTYYLKETKAPDKGFSASTSYIQVTLKAGEIKTAQVEDEPEATLQVEKGIKASNIDVIAKSADYSLNGAVYQLYDANKKALSGKTYTIQAKETDKVGTSKEKYTLAPGTYYLKETKKPDKGFAMSSEFVKVELKAGEVKTAKVEEEPEAPLTLVKGIKGNNADEIAKDNSYSIKGAVYQLYDSEKKEIAGKTFTTGEQKNGEASSTITGLAPGTYYVKETKAPKGFELDSTFYIAEVKAGVKNEVKVYDSIEKGYAYLQKGISDKDAAIVKANANYDLLKTQYGVYSSDPATDTKAEAIAKLTATKTGDGVATSDTIRLDPGTYYVKELAVGTNFLMDADSHKVTVSMSNDANSPAIFKVADSPKRVNITITKGSTNTRISAGYSLKGAVYTLTGTDATGKVSIDATTDEQGVATWSNLLIDDYTIVEKTAPEKFLKDDSSYTVKAADLSALANGDTYKVAKDFVDKGTNETVQGKVPETPKYKHYQFKKVDDVTKGATHGTASVAGAEFEVTYYFGYYSNETELGTKPFAGQWILKADENGDVLFDQAHLVKKCGNTQVDYFTDGDVTNIWPDGTYTIREVKAPVGYSITYKGKTFVQINIDGATKIGEVVSPGVFEDTLLRGDVTVTKVDAETKESAPQGAASFKDIEFEIVNKSDGPVTSPIDGKTMVEKDQVVCTIKTKEVTENNIKAYKASTKDLTLPEGWTAGALASGQYQIREAKVSAGYEVNSEWKQDFTIDGESDIQFVDDKTWAPNQVIRGGVKVGKIDRQNQQAKPQGSATLEGMVFGVFSKNANKVVVRGLGAESGNLPAETMTCDAWNNETTHAALADDAIGTQTTDGVLVAKIKTKAVKDDEGNIVKYVAETNADTLPYGAYTIAELEVPTDSGYLRDKVSRDWRMPFSIGADLANTGDENTFTTETGKFVDLTHDAKYCASNYVRRGDLIIHKTAKDGAIMAGIPFMIVSKTTGETHMVVTDKDGNIDTSATEDKVTYDGKEVVLNHSFNTNANDAPLIKNEAGVAIFADREQGRHADLGKIAHLDSEGFVVLEDGSTPNFQSENGVWFNGRVDANTIREQEYAEKTSFDPAAPLKVDDTLGALPYDTYYIYELYATERQTKDLRSGEEYTTKNNKDYRLGNELENRTLRIQGEDLGDDYVKQKKAEKANIPTADIINYLKPVVGTILVAEKTSSHYVQVDGTMVTFDTVNYQHLMEGREYKITGQLHKIDGEGKDAGLVQVNNADAGDETKTKVSTEVFKAETEDGTAIVKFEIANAEDVNGFGVVAFEEMYENPNSDDPELVATHADLTDFSQTVMFPIVSTTLKNTQGEEHEAVAASAKLVDTVTYKGLVPNTTYTLRGELHVRNADGTDGGIALDAKGNAIEMKEAKTFTPTKYQDTIDVPYEFEAPNLGGKTLVAFERIYDTNDVLIAKHEDINDKAQTIYLPGITTNATDAATAGHVGRLGDKVAINDMVAYENLQDGKTYTITGTVMDKEKNEPIVDAEGKNITASKTFVAGEDEGAVKADGRVSGHVLVAFDVPAEAVSGKVVVVFEKCYSGSETDVPEQKTPEANENTDNEADDNNEAENTEKNDNGNEAVNEQIKTEVASGNNLVAVHEDINALSQTIGYPKVTTNASDETTNLHEGWAQDHAINVVDNVSYTSLIKGQEYTIKGTLMNKATGEPIKNSDDQPVTAEQKFIAGEGMNIDDGQYVSGSLKLTFTVPGATLAGTTAVAFEQLYAGDVLVGSHEDINDTEQTVNYSKLETNAVDSKTNDHFGLAEGQVVIKDEVRYTGLVAGTEYILRGTLMDKGTNKPIQANGQDATVLAKLVPEGEAGTRVDGSITIQVEVPAEAVAGKSTVMFEELFLDNQKVGSHEDINDSAQEVDYPSVFTTATDVATGQHIGLAAEGAQVVDAVHYSRLVAGKTYTIKGVLMDKATGEPFTADGKQMTAEATFIAGQGEDTIAADGTIVDGVVNITFDVPASVAGHAVVAFEELYDGETLVAYHKDINDAEQTVNYPSVATTATVNGEKSVIATDPDNPTVNIVDHVVYTGLIPGMNYRLEGTMVSKADGSAAQDNAGPVRTTLDFTPTEANGEIDLTFNVNAFQLKVSNPEKENVIPDMVAFEKLFVVNGDKTAEVGHHEDLNDEAQTVHVGSQMPEDELIVSNPQPQVVQQSEPARIIGSDTPMAKTEDIVLYGIVGTLIAALIAAGSVFIVRRSRNR